MSDKIFTNFDPERYRAAYPDVGLSGLDPTAHYLRFGRLFGRDPTGAGAPTPRPTPPEAPHVDAESSGGDGYPIIDKPAGLHAGESASSLEPGQKQGPAPRVTIEDLARGPFSSPEAQEELCAALASYAHMFSLTSLVARPNAGDRPLCGSARFQHGEVRIENAWFVDGPALRLWIKGGKGDAPSHFAGWTVAAYQARPGDPADLRMAGEPLRFPPSGPVFHDIQLLHPLMPLILLLSDVDGLVHGIALLPFPSLLWSGIHAAELTALQAEFTPMDAFWSLSEALLREFLGHPEWGERSIGSLGVVQQGSAAGHVRMSPEFRDWLQSLFGLQVDSAQDAAAGLCLTLPDDSVPTISALVSRRLDVGRAASAVGPFLIAESPDNRPRWSVSLPAGCDSGTSAPTLAATKSDPAAKKLPPKANPVHLAIALREAGAADAIAAQGPMPEEAPEAASQAGPLTVILEATDAVRTEGALRALRRAAGDDADLELLVRFSERGDEVPEVLDDLAGADGWAEIPASRDLRSIARDARHEILLTISDLVTLHDYRAVPLLCAILRSNESVASSSCVLVQERVIKKEVITEQASGGLFPAGVSFTSSPRLNFHEPDVLQALRGMTYPVVANRLLLTAWRAPALAELPPPRGPVPATAADIRIGLDLLDAGYRNLCTTKVSGHLSRPYRRRELIDPVGGSYADPERWQHIFDQVTLLREL